MINWSNDPEEEMDEWDPSITNIERLWIEFDTTQPILITNDRREMLQKLAAQQLRPEQLHVWIMFGTQTSAAQVDGVASELKQFFMACDPKFFQAVNDVTLLYTHEQDEDNIADKYDIPRLSHLEQTICDTCFGLCKNVKTLSLRAGQRMQYPFTTGLQYFQKYPWSNLSTVHLSFGVHARATFVQVLQMFLAHSQTISSLDMHLYIYLWSEDGILFAPPRRSLINTQPYASTQLAQSIRQDLEQWENSPFRLEFDSSEDQSSSEFKPKWESTLSIEDAADLAFVVASMPIQNIIMTTDGSSWEFACYAPFMWKYMKSLTSFTAADCIMIGIDECPNVRKLTIDYMKENAPHPELVRLIQRDTLESIDVTFARNPRPYMSVLPTLTRLRSVKGVRQCDAQEWLAEKSAREKYPNVFFPQLVSLEVALSREKNIIQLDERLVYKLQDLSISNVSCKELARLVRAAPDLTTLKVENIQIKDDLDFLRLLLAINSNSTLSFVEIDGAWVHVFKGTSRVDWVSVLNRRTLLTFDIPPGMFFLTLPSNQAKEMRSKYIKQQMMLEKRMVQNRLANGMQELLNAYIMCLSAKRNHKLIDLCANSTLYNRFLPIVEKNMKYDVANDKYYWPNQTRLKKLREWLAERVYGDSLIAKVKSASTPEQYMEASDKLRALEKWQMTTFGRLITRQSTDEIDQTRAKGLTVAPAPRTNRADKRRYQDMSQDTSIDESKEDFKEEKVTQSSAASSSSSMAGLFGSSGAGSSAAVSGSSAAVSGSGAAVSGSGATVASTVPVAVSMTVDDMRPFAGQRRQQQSIIAPPTETASSTEILQNEKMHSSLRPQDGTLGRVSPLMEKRMQFNARYWKSL